MAESLELVPYRRFEGRPPPNYIAEIQQIISDTATPELCADLHKGPISNREPFLILAPVSIPRDRREDGTKAPCPMCSPNRFYEGKLVYFPRLHAVAVIGHCCAASDVRNEAEAQYRREQALEWAQDFLITELPKSSTRAQQVIDALPAAQEAQRVHHELKSRASWYVNLLRRVTKGSGRLSVDEVVERRGDGPRGFRGSGSEFDTRTIDFGELRGRSIFATKFAPVDQLVGAQMIFQRYAAATEEVALDAIVSMDEQERLDAKDALAHGISHLKLTMESLTDFRRFFDPENIRRINDWGAHPAGQHRLRIECRRRPQLANRVVLNLSGGPRDAGFVIEDTLRLP